MILSKYCDQNTYRGCTPSLLHRNFRCDSLKTSWGVLQPRDAEYYSITDNRRDAKSRLSTDLIIHCAVPFRVLLVGLPPTSSFPSPLAARSLFCDDPNFGPFLFQPPSLPLDFLRLSLQYSACKSASVSACEVFLFFDPGGRPLFLLGGKSASDIGPYEGSGDVLRSASACRLSSRNMGMKVDVLRASVLLLLP
ncbi:hypothetical protein BD309DRAFT_956598 [Dichomitus squalens]|nr:hypothetical protein BD309DRAFT_956598 [Dichomitus squalens]